MISKQDIPKFWLYYFAVDKNCQREGIGTLLLKKAESKIKKGRMLFTDIEKDDRSGIEFYEKNGFKIVGRSGKWFENYRSAIIMAKKII